MLDGVKSRFRIYNNRFQKINVFKNREYLFSDVEGFRMTDRNLLIEVLEKGKKPIEISKYYGNFTQLKGFLETHFVNLDAEEMYQNELALYEREHRLASKNATKSRLKKYGEWIGVLNTSAWIFAAWFVFYPNLYDFLAILNVILPILALVLFWTNTSLIQIFKVKNNPKLSVGDALALPSIALAYRVIFDFEIMDYGQVYQPVAMVAGFFFLMIWILSFEELKESKITEKLIVYTIFIVVITAYSLGVVLAVNSIPDRNPHQTFMVGVIDKKKSRSRYSMDYYLYLDRWDIQKAGKKMSVTSEEFKKYRKDDEIPLFLHQGYLGIKWYRVSERITKWH